MSGTNPESSFVEDVKDAADDLEKKGWLIKYPHHETGEIMWELTPAGRKAFNLPPVTSH